MFNNFQIGCHIVNLGFLMFSSAESWAGIYWFIALCSAIAEMLLFLMWHSWFFCCRSLFIHCIPFSIYDYTECCLKQGLRMYCSIALTRLRKNCAFRKNLQIYSQFFSFFEKLIWLQHNFLLLLTNVEYTTFIWFHCSKRMANTFK